MKARMQIRVGGSACKEKMRMEVTDRPLQMQKVGESGGEEWAATVDVETG